MGLQPMQLLAPSTMKDWQTGEIVGILDFTSSGLKCCTDGLSGNFVGSYSLEVPGGERDKSPTFKLIAPQHLNPQATSIYGSSLLHKSPRLVTPGQSIRRITPVKT